MIRRARGGHGAGDAVDAAVAQRGNADVRVRALAAADNALREGYRVEQRVVAVEDGDAVGVEVFKDLAFGFQNALARA